MRFCLSLSKAGKFIRLITHPSMRNTELVAACGKNQQTFMDLTGNKSSYAANLTFTAARKVPEAFCARAVELCLQADRDMKRSVDEPERLLEVLIATLWQEARRG